MTFFAFWPPSLCRFEAIASYCRNQHVAASDAGAQKTSARLDGDRYASDGSKQFFSGVGTSDPSVKARAGGYGCAAEYGVEASVRDLGVYQILERANQILRMIVARGLVQS